ncbi:MAG TPA: hypothetical protein VF746_22075 [Longimicrobium sp.]|jgi:hypothetical protein
MRIEPLFRALRGAGGWLVSQLPEIVLQCIVLVISIVVALAVDQWTSERSDRELALQSLDSFELEIRQNQRRLEDSGPFRAGLREVLVRMEESGRLGTMDEFYSTVGLEALRPPHLLDTAWQAALVTDALSRMDYATVSALSLTYSRQDRYRSFSEEGLPAALRPGGTPGAEAPAAIRSTILYLSEAIEDEEELVVVYQQALQRIEAARRRLGGT